MRAAKIVLLTLGGVVVVAALSGWLLLKQGLSAREKPSRLEARMARIARRIATPAGARLMENPYTPTQESISEAMKHFVEHCAACHALDGSGDTVFGRNMYPRTPDLRSQESQSLTDGELYYIISNGVRFTGMPAFAGEESAEEIWELVPFLRRLPHLSEEELEEMQSRTTGETDEEKAATSDPSHVHDGIR